MNILAQATIPTTARGGTPDAASLERLHDIVAPPPVPFWPPAPGWLVLAAGVAVIGLLLLIAWLRRYRLNRYRRAALAELDDIDPWAAGAAERVTVVLKRTALSAYPRSEVASLSGARWTRFLSRTTPRPLPGGEGEQLLSRGQYAAPVPKDPRVAPLAVIAARWVRSHRRADAAAPARESDTTGPEC